MSAADDLTGSERPWWSSEDPGTADDEAPPRGDEAADEGDRARIPPHRHGADADPQVCQVCPVCAFLRVVEDARPEVLEHLTEATHHLTLAAKAFLDHYADGFDGRGDARRGRGLERIDLDDE